MKEQKQYWHRKVCLALEKLAGEQGVEAPDISPKLSVGTAPKPELGDLAFPLFPLAGIFRKSPGILAGELAAALQEEGDFFPAGPYLNLRLDRPSFLADLLAALEEQGEHWGEGKAQEGRKVMIEFSSPNTNKPLHLGHLRNNILGVSCARLLQSQGALVQKINLVNDRGVHICKSMLAYQKFGKGETPESRGVKPDKFVGDLYVEFARWAKDNPQGEEEAQKMLQDWEAGVPEIRDLWETMNRWALQGIEATYQRTGVSFDKVYRESETYLLGKDVVLQGRDSQVFYQEKDGSIRVDMQDIGLDTKVLLRSDGTSVYITQDLGTAIHRHKDWPFDELIYVVGSEQEYHFKVLFHILEKLGFPWARRLRHLSYGMVFLPQGKMKSREGTVVDADDLIDNLAALALEEIKKKGRDKEVGDPVETGEKIALAALHYFLLQVSPVKDMIFNPQESLSFTGNTGPYLQYMTSRVASLLRKAPPEVQQAVPDPACLTLDEEWVLAKRVGEFPEVVSRAAAALDPSLLAGALYALAKDFSRYYHEVPIIKAENPVLGASRLALSRGVLTTLRKGFSLLNLPYLEIM